MAFHAPSSLDPSFELPAIKRVARVWSPDQINDIAVRQQVLAQMQSGERGVVRLEAAQARLAPEIVQKVIVSLNAPPRLRKSKLRPWI